MNKRPYPLKSTNIPWCPQIPSHWEVKKIREVFEERREKNTDKKENFILSVLKDVGVIPYSEKGNIGNRYSDRIEDYKIVHKDDMVLNSMNMMIGSLGKSNYRGILSSVYYVLKIINKNEADVNYIEYVFKNSSFYEPLRIFGKGILDYRLRVPMEHLKNYSFPLPPLSEQQRIVEYLDWKIGEIDLAISTIKEKITKLKQLKESLITNVVTGQIDVRNIVIPQYEKVTVNDEIEKEI